MKQSRKFIFGILLSLLGLLANICSLQLFEGFNYLFGSIPVFIALRTLGIRWAFVCAVIASSWVNVLFWHPTAMLWLSLEPVFVGLMIRHTRLKNIVIWDAIYWPLIGNVILWIFFQYIMGVPVIGTFGAMLMFWLIGINNCLVAELILAFLPVDRWMGSAQKKKVSLSRILFSIMITVVWIPAFVIMTLNGQRISEEGKHQIRAGLRTAGAYAEMALENRDLSWLTASMFQARFDWLQQADFPYRFTLTDGTAQVLQTTRTDLKSGEIYTLETAGILLPLSENTYRVIPRLKQKVPRWRLAQLSYFVRTVQIRGGYTLFIEIPFGPFQSRVLKGQLYALLVLLLLDLIILACAFFFSDALTRTLSRLSEITKDLPEKVYRQEVSKWPDSSILEISLLIDNFKETAGALREKFFEIKAANEGLENRVQERTAALEKANQELTDEMERRKAIEAERALLEEKFRHADKMESLGRLAGGVAHDFNNLLTPILGYAEMLEDYYEPHQPQHKSLQHIIDASLKAASLTRQILAFSRKQVLEFQTISLNKTITDFSGMLKRIIGEDIEYRLELEAIPDTIRADASQVQQIIMNLAVNGKDAMPAGGKLIIRTESISVDQVYASALESVEPGRYVMLVVSDTGSGIDPETLTHIFEPFFTTKELNKGTGLGLATVYGIVKQHSGGVHVYSEMGKGSIFKIYFPEDASEESAKEEQILLDDLHGGETLLVVEDNDLVRGIILSILKKYGYTGMSASSAEEGLEMLQEQKGQVDLLLTDVVLTKMNGLELYQKAKAFLPQLRILFISGYTADVISDKTRIEGDMTILQKPFTTRDLLTHIRSILER